MKTFNSRGRKLQEKVQHHRQSSTPISSVLGNFVWHQKLINFTAFWCSSYFNGYPSDTLRGAKSHSTFNFTFTKAKYFISNFIIIATSSIIKWRTSLFYVSCRVREFTIKVREKFHRKFFNDQLPTTFWCHHHEPRARCINWHEREAYMKSFSILCQFHPHSTHPPCDSFELIKFSISPVSLKASFEWSWTFGWGRWFWKFLAHIYTSSQARLWSVR